MASTAPQENANLMTSTTSPYGRVCRIAIAELGIEAHIQLTFVKLRSSENEILHHNPTGKAPTLLIDGGQILSETRFICQYFQALVGRTDFMTSNSDLDAQAIEGIVTGFIDGVSVWIRELRRPSEDRSSDILRQETDRAQRCVAWFDANVNDLDVEVTYCSAHLFIALETLEGVAKYAWRGDAPALSNWFDAMSQRPAVLKASQ